MPTPDLPHSELAANLSALRGMLHEQREFRREQLAQLAEQPGTGSRPGGPPHSDDHAADAAQAEVTEALTLAARQALDDVELALERIQTGRYGTCMSCGGTISLDRLYIIPQSKQCEDCQRRTDRRGSYP
jgi:DnaK suppressor protein